MRLVIAFLGLAATASAYDCPAHSKHVYGPEYFGDCECDSGYEKKGYECVEIESSSGDTWGTQGAQKLICEGAGAWSGSSSMATWCTSNCNHFTPYCPTSHCSCTSGRRLQQPDADQVLEPEPIRFEEREPIICVIPRGPGLKSVPNATTFAECTQCNKMFGGVYLDVSNESQVRMCQMFELMDVLVYNPARTAQSVDDDEMVTFEQYKGHIGASNQGIEYTAMFKSFTIISGQSGEANGKMDQNEWRKYWENPGASIYGSQSASANQGSTGVSVGAVAACVVASVGAGIGIGYFAKGQQAGRAASAKDHEMRMVLSGEDDGHL